MQPSVSKIQCTKLCCVPCSIVDHFCGCNKWTWRPLGNAKPQKKKSYFVENIEVSISVADILEVALDKGLSALRATPSVLRLYLASVVYRMQQVSVRHKSTGYFSCLLSHAALWKRRAFSKRPLQGDSSVVLFPVSCSYSTTVRLRKAAPWIVRMMALDLPVFCLLLCSLRACHLAQRECDNEGYHSLHRCVKL